MKLILSLLNIVCCMSFFVHPVFAKGSSRTECFQKAKEFELNSFQAQSVCQPVTPYTANCIHVARNTGLTAHETVQACYKARKHTASCVFHSFYSGKSIKDLLKSCK